MVEIEVELDKDDYKNKNEEEKYDFLIKTMKDAVNQALGRKVREENIGEDKTMDKNKNKDRNGKGNRKRNPVEW